MYTKFTKTEDGGYALKKQGMISLVLIGTGIGVLAFFLFKRYVANTAIKANLWFALLMLIFCVITFWRSTKKFIIYPQQRIFKYSKGAMAGFTSFKFEELEGSTHETVKNMYGIISGNSLKLEFNQNGKSKDIVLGQNLSAKTIRNINEEIKQIMNNG